MPGSDSPELKARIDCGLTDDLSSASTRSDFQKWIEAPAIRQSFTP